MEGARASVLWAGFRAALRFALHICLRVGLRALLILPMAVLVYLSLQQAWRFPRLFSGEWTLQHWAATLQGQNSLLSSLGISLLLSGSVALLAAVSGFIVSAAVMQQKHARRWLSLAYFPYLIAPVVFAAMLQFYFVRFAWSGTPGGVVLAQYLFVFPYAVLFFSGFWTDRMRRLTAQARTLGASTREVWLRVLWPLGRPVLAMGLFQCFLLSWFEYGLTRLLGVGKVHTLTIQTVLYVQEANPHLAAVASLLMIVPALLLLFLNRQLLLRKPLL
jgi:putative spermidine/putrescine transport system permease protein